MALRKFHDEGIGGRIREIRNALGLSQEEFGKAAGKYSQDTVAKWEAKEFQSSPAPKSGRYTGS